LEVSGKEIARSPLKMQAKAKIQIEDFTGRKKSKKDFDCRRN